LAEEKRIVPPSEDGVEVVYVGPTGDYTAHLLKSTHPRHASVKNQFRKSWKKLDDGLPRVERIYWIHVKPEIIAKFEALSKKIGNVQRRFHGTSQNTKCEFGSNPSKHPCPGKKCPVCSICQNSFDIGQAKRGPGGTAWAQQVIPLRYGEGIYFSPVSSKSNDYSFLSERPGGSPKKPRKWRCMFLCNVALGRAYETKEGILTGDLPPPGHDSVIGLTGPNLNYDECVVYNSAQCIPSYLIVYSLNAAVRTA